MTEEDSNKEPKRLNAFKVTADEFIRFLSEKTGASDPCPVCQADDWGVLCPAGDEALTYRFGNLVRNMERQFYVSSFAYYCASCGYMRHHMARVVFEWVQANPTDVPFVADSMEVPGIDYDE